MYTLTRFSLTEAELRLRHGRRAEAEAERVGPAHQLLEGAAAEAPARGERDTVRSMHRVITLTLTLTLTLPLTLTLTLTLTLAAPCHVPC